VQISPTRRSFPNEFRKYWAILQTQVANSFAYPADLLYRSISIVLFMWIFAQLWRVTYGASGESVIAGLTLRDTMWYLMLAETMILSRPRVSTTIAENVKDGTIAYLLNKPYNFILYQFSFGLGDSLLRMITNSLVGGVVVWFLVGPPPDPRGWHLVLIAVLLAWIIDFCLNAMLGLLAFITEEIAAFEWIYNKFVLILGGVLIPLDFFPDWLQSIAFSLPFAYSVYGPARLFVDPTLSRFLDLILIQGLWVIALGVVLALLYRKGTAWLSINGG